MVVDLHIVHQSALQLGCCGKARLLDDLTNAAIETLNHAIGLRMARWAQTVLNAHRFAEHIKLVISTWLTLFVGKTIRELATVIGEYFGDFYGSRLLQTGQKIHTAVFTLIWVDMHEHPARAMATYK